MKLRGRVAVYISCDKQDYTVNFSKVLYWKHIRTMCLHWLFYWSLFLRHKHM